MFEYRQIVDVLGREILDSSGNPTVEVEVLAEGGIVGRACVPSGDSAGKTGAVELRDGEERYGGLGVTQAVHHINSILADAVIGENVLQQKQIDQILLRADGTANKSNLGGNALLAVSLAVAKTAAQCVNLPLYRYLGGIRSHKLPTPVMSVLSSGRRADGTADQREFMLVPAKDCLFSEGLRRCTEIYHCLQKILRERGLPAGVGDEGSFVMEPGGAGEAMEVLTEAVEAAGYRPGEDVFFALDAAASGSYDAKTGTYLLPGEERAEGSGAGRTAEQLTEYYRELADRFPIASIEDALQEEDWTGWQNLTRELGGRVQLVGDDLFAASVERLKHGIALGAANAILLRVNQAGTLTETLEAVEAAQRAGYRTIISQCFGETEDTFIADLAVACGADQIKTGAPCGGERTAKYNRLLRIQEQLS